MNTDSWPGLTLDRPTTDGHRNSVWLGTYQSERVAVRHSRRSINSLTWELDLLAAAAGLGVNVAAPVPTADGRLHVNGVVVQRWVDGREPSTLQEWHLVAEQLHRLHDATAEHAQRPTCCRVTELRRERRSVDADLTALPPAVRDLVLEVFDDFRDAPVAVVHGDPGASNIRLGSDDRVWLLDWDESRVDVCWLDLANLGVQVLGDDTNHRATVLAHAWEAINAWTAEPRYARQRLAELQLALAHRR